MSTLPQLAFGVLSLHQVGLIAVILTDELSFLAVGEQGNMQGVGLRVDIVQNIDLLVLRLAISEHLLLYLLMRGVIIDLIVVNPKLGECRIEDMLIQIER